MVRLFGQKDSGMNRENIPHVARGLEAHRDPPNVFPTVPVAL